MEFQEIYGRWRLQKEGKVRKIFVSNDGKEVALVATDGVSAFDQKLGIRIPDKDQIITDLAAWWSNWYDRGAVDTMGNGTLCSTAFLATDRRVSEDSVGEELDPDLRHSDLKGRVTEQLELTMLPVEWIVRGYVTGSLEQAYRAGATELCGIPLHGWMCENPDAALNSAIPVDGLVRPGDKLDQPMFTPTTKASEGQHDENINREQLIDLLYGMPEFVDYIVERLELHSPDEVTRKGVATIVDQISAALVEFYSAAAAYAEERGLIIADAKFEVGIYDGCQLYIGDEILTFDCARYWDKAAYDDGRIVSMDKQIIRDFLKEAKARGEETPVIPDEIIAQSRAGMLEIHRRITGEKWEP